MVQIESPRDLSQAVIECPEFDRRWASQDIPSQVPALSGCHTPKLVLWCPARLSHYRFAVRTDAMKLIAVYTTTGTIEEAREIASSLVQQRLVACAQISEIESFYTWNTTLQNTREFRLTLKTTEAKYSAVEAAIRAMHSYELPAIYAVAVQIAYTPYAAWVEETSAGN